MPDDEEQIQKLREQVRELEELLRQVPTLWVRCRSEGSLSLREPGTASHEFLKLVYNIEKKVLSS